LCYKIAGEKNIGKTNKNENKTQFLI